LTDTALCLNPGIEIIVRTDSEEESKLLQKGGVGLVYFGEEELAKGMSHHVLQRFTPNLG
jgi:CPA2 family monovalent cation:H+ antiporter-2